jgi:4a-hydroxytetrahydrobiopterin dehydratase
MIDLSNESITTPCGESPLVTDDKMPGLLAQIPEWTTVEVEGVPRLRRTFRFSSYREGLAFVQRVGDVAEHEGHHPVMTVEWGKVRVSWWTHSTKGLLRNDFIMAAKTDGVFADRSLDAAATPSQPKNG